MAQKIKVSTGSIESFDKFIIVYNFRNICEIYNQGFCFDKIEIKKEPNLVGIWRIKRKKIDKDKKDLRLLKGKDFDKTIIKILSKKINKFDRFESLAKYVYDRYILTDSQWCGVLGFWESCSDISFFEPEIKPAEPAAQSEILKYVLNELDTQSDPNLYIIIVDALRKYPDCNLSDLEKELTLNDIIWV